MSYALQQLVTIIFGLYLYHLVSAMMNAMFAFDEDAKLFWEIIIGIGLAVAMFYFYVWQY